MNELLLGDEAVAVAALDAGIRGAFSYPGTPATEIFEYIERQAAARKGDVSATWSTNEKVAYEEALGMSYAGYRSLVSMKHVGLNVAADPFINSALTGANGALVVAVADDPGMHSSQNEQDTRYYAEFAQLPLFEPCNQQEAYDMTRDAFVLSEALGLPVLVRLVTRLSHSRSVVRRTGPAESVPARPRPDPRDWTLLPVNARRRFRRLLDMQASLREFSAQSQYNVLALRGPRGIIATGIAYNYVREVIGDDSAYSLLRVGTYPVPVGKVRELIGHCSDILVVEEGYPYLESQLIGMLGVPGKAIQGKRDGTLPLDGEMSANRVRTALGMASVNTLETPIQLPGRPPALCQGCPHCDTFAMINEAVRNESSPILFSDIGCYTLGALPPYNAAQSCVDMGASISMALGAAKAGAHPVLCTIGDSTFTHSGMTPLLAAAHANANMTVILLDNSTVGMTGGQEVFATGEQFTRLIKGLGVCEDHLVMFEPLKKNHAEGVQMLQREIEHRGLSVIVACRPCIHYKRKMSTNKPSREVPVTA